MSRPARYADVPLTPAQRKLAESCIRMAWSVALGERQRCPWLSVDECLDEAFSALVRAAQKYDPALLIKGKPVKFGTYTYVCLTNRFRSLRWEYYFRPRSCRPERPFADLAEDAGDPPDHRAPLNAEEQRLAEVHRVFLACRRLCNRQEWRILNMRFVKGMKLRDMAKRMHVSKSRVGQVVQQVLASVRRKWEDACQPD